MRMSCACAYKNNKIFKKCWPWNLIEKLNLVTWCHYLCLTHGNLPCCWQEYVSGSDLKWWNKLCIHFIIHCFLHFLALGGFKNAYELLNLRALKISMLYKICIFQCMDKIFCVEFQRIPLKFHTKYHTHTLKDVDIIHKWKFKSS